MAFEERLVDPHSLVLDATRRYGEFEPVNFDRVEHGEVTIREALLQSLNTTAVLLLDKLGAAKFSARLRLAGTPIRTGIPDAQAGLAIALGGGGFRLWDLVTLYAGFANDGVVRPLTLRREEAETNTGRRVLTERAARSVLNILADAQTPRTILRETFVQGGRRIAFKTGTSYGYRDAWAIGLDKDHTIGVWVGRPDGYTSGKRTGLSTAAPIMFAAFEHLPRAATDVAAEYREDYRPDELPMRLGRLDAASPMGGQGHRLTITYPVNNSEIVLNPGERRAVLHVRAKGGIPPLFMILNGQILPGSRLNPYRLDVEVGAHQLKVIDNQGNQDIVQFRLLAEGDP